MTRQFRTISTYLAAQQSFLSAQEVHAGLRVQGEKIGLATVYRTLQRMADDGSLDVIMKDGTEATYRQCGGSQHHHLVCRSCGLAHSVEVPSLDSWLNKVANQFEFRELEHDIEIRGLCSDCADE